ILQGQGILSGEDRAHDLREKGEGSGTHRWQSEQVVHMFAYLRQPASHLGETLRVGILVAPRADRPATLDLLVRALEPRQESGRIGRTVRRGQDRISR